MKYLDSDGLLYFWGLIKSKIANAVSTKVDKVDGKGLSTNDYTTAEKNKLSGIASGAQVNVIESVKVNGTALTPSSKAVNINLSGYSKTDHTHTKAAIGLGNVTNDAQVKRTEMGKANGVATLDATGKVPSAQLPSYVDDVLEGYYSSSKFYTTKASDGTYSGEIAGETGKIYVDLNTNKTYRWSGSVWTVISETLALGETASTAYAGSKGKANADAIAAITKGTTKVPKATNADTVGGFTIGVSVPANAKFTDTTYSDMKAATASAAGTHGLVPAPAAGKQSQYLRGDGTWATPTNTDTHYTAKNVVGASATAQSNVTASTANPYLNLVENGAVRSAFRISGGGATTVKTDANGNLTISSVNTTYDLSGYAKTADLVAISNTEIDTIVAS